MRTVLSSLTAWTIIGLMAAPAAAQGPRGRGLLPQAAARFGWLSDYRQATELARTSGKPLMVVIRCIP